MKRSAKVAIIVAVCLIVVGLLVGAAVTFFQSRSRGWQDPFDGSFLDTITSRESGEYAKRTETFSAADVKGLELTTISRDVKFVVGASSEYRITCWENEDRWFEIELDGRTIKVREKRRSLALGDDHAAEEYRTLTVEVPAKCTAATVTTTSGDIYIPALTVDGGLTVVTTSGELYASDSLEILGGATVATTSGSVLFSGKLKGGFSFSSTSGDLSFSGEAEDFTAKTTSGDLVLSGCAFSGRAEVTTVSGTITADGFVCGPLKLHTTSGDISISSLDSGEIEIDTTSGDVALTLADPDAFRYEVKTTAGEVRTPYGSSSGVLCDVHTTSGDVVIR